MIFLIHKSATGGHLLNIVGNIIVISTRQDWKEKRDSLPGNGTNWYTDGSKLGDATGTGFYCGKDEKDTFIFLGKNTTVFQAELFAIQKCAERIL